MTYSDYEWETKSEEEIYENPEILLADWSENFDKLDETFNLTLEKKIVPSQNFCQEFWEGSKNLNLTLLLIGPSSKIEKKVHRDFFRAISSVFCDLPPEEVFTISFKTTVELEQMVNLIDMIYLNQKQIKLTEGWRKIIILLHLLYRFDIFLFKFKTNKPINTKLVFLFLADYPISDEDLKTILTDPKTKQLISCHDLDFLKDNLLLRLIYLFKDYDLIKRGLKLGLKFKIVWEPHLTETLLLLILDNPRFLGDLDEIIIFKEETDIIRFATDLIQEDQSMTLMERIFRTFIYKNVHKKVKLWSQFFDLTEFVKFKEDYLKRINLKFLKEVLALPGKVKIRIYKENLFGLDCYDCYLSYHPDKPDFVLGNLGFYYEEELKNFLQLVEENKEEVRNLISRKRYRKILAAYKENFG